MRVEGCLNCPTKEKIKLYWRAGDDWKLARKLGIEQGLKLDYGLMEHYDRTGDQLLIGCLSGMMCRTRYADSPVTQALRSHEIL